MKNLKTTYFSFSWIGYAVAFVLVCAGFLSLRLSYEHLQKLYVTQSSLIEYEQTVKESHIAVQNLLLAQDPAQRYQVRVLLRDFSREIEHWSLPSDLQYLDDMQKEYVEILDALAKQEDVAMTSARHKSYFMLSKAYGEQGEIYKSQITSAKFRLRSRAVTAFVAACSAIIVVAFVSICQGAAVQNMIRQESLDVIDSQKRGVGRIARGVKKKGDAEPEVAPDVRVAEYAHEVSHEPAFAPMPSPVRPARGDDGVLDRALLDHAKEMTEERFPMIVEYFLEDAEKYIEQITQALGGRDFSKLAASAHTLKSSARQLGALKLSLVAEDLEINARDENAHHEQGKFTALLSELNDNYTKTERALKDTVKMLGDTEGV